MTPGLKRTSHAWSEAFIGAEWVPFCPLNGYFAKLPRQYLQIAVSDRALFRHTRDIDFDWSFKTRQVESTKEEVLLANIRSPYNILRVWESLKGAEISLEFLVTMLMIPFGALVVVLARNVVGVLPFGTFMPMLIAVAFRKTGFFWGIILLSAVMLIGGVARELLNRIYTLHIPRLAVILTLCVIFILALAVVAVKFGKPELAGVSIFPLAIMTLTTERFTEMLDSDGYKVALHRLLVTYVLSAACYAVMNLFWLQAIVMAFPELLVAVIGFNILIGGWDGLRLCEYFRFRHLLERDPIKVGKIGDAK